MQCMTIKNGKINPLNVLGLRKVEFPAHHFSYTTLSQYNKSYVAKIEQWIRANLAGRYYIGLYLALSADNSFVYTTKVGFEQGKELSFFNLACPVSTF